MNRFTGRDLIVYIMENHLENVPVLNEEFFKGFKTVGAVAEYFNVGIATVEVWYNEGILDGFKINDKVYISPKSIDRLKQIRDVYGWR